MIAAQSALARRTIGVGGLTAAGLSASSPLTVVGGGVIATYASAGVTAVPLAILVVTGVLWLLTVGYLTLARDAGQAATFYAVLGRGLGRTVGVSGAAVAVVGYYAIQTSLYGLAGVTIAGSVGGPWWLWAAIVWMLVAVAGLSRSTVGTRLIVSVLAGQLAILGLLVVAALTHPAHGRITLTGWDPSELASGGAGGAVVLCVAAFIGIESSTSYAEEAHTTTAVQTAIRVGLLAAGSLYALAAWAIGVAAGPDQVAELAGSATAGLPWSILDDAYGPVIAALAGLLLVLAIVTAMIALHSVAARYVFCLARDRILPTALAATTTGGAPLGGSLAQTTAAGGVITAAFVFDLDPMALFTTLSSVAAVAVIALLTATSAAAAVVGFSQPASKRRGWEHRVGPVLGLVVGIGVLTIMVANLHTLLGVPTGSPLRYAVPTVVATAAFVGLGWAVVLRYTAPAVWATVGGDGPDPLEVPDRRLAHLEL